jgi:hypothetical protein
MSLPYVNRVATGRGADNGDKCGHRLPLMKGIILDGEDVEV